MVKLTADRLRSLIEYNAEDGVLRWRVQRGRAKPGDVAGRVHKTTGYREIRIDGRGYLAHRLTWLHVHGSWPELSIDHKNGCKTDNRIENLREATPSQNQANRHKSPRNTSGFKGVSYSGTARKWVACIRINGRGQTIGHFDSPQDAALAYARRADVLFGEFARAGRV